MQRDLRHAACDEIKGHGSGLRPAVVPSSRALAAAILICLFAIPLGVRAQSLAELAEKARSERGPEQCKVWVNEDLERLGESASLGKATVNPCSRAPSTTSRRPAIPESVLTQGVGTEAEGADDYTTSAASVPAPIPGGGQFEQSQPAEVSSGYFAAQQQAEIRPVPTRWRTYSLEGHPQLTYGILNPYHQNILKADYPVGGAWFLELDALNTTVYKSRRNLDFSRVFADQISAGTLSFFSHNSFYGENIIFGAELRRHDDTFVPSNFRFHINGVGDYKRNINAFTPGSASSAHLFDAYADFLLGDLGEHNFDLLFLRAGLQGFKSDFHGLIFNDAGLGGRLFGEAKKNRLRYDIAYFKLFAKDPVSGFIDFTRPSRHQVAIARLTWEDFLRPGWNSEWTFHYNYDKSRVAGSSQRLDLNTYYFGASFNGHLGRWVFNPAFYGVAGHAERLEPASVADHTVAAWMALLDLQYPFDFWNFRLGYVYASGDSDPTDRRDTGFDAISDGVVLFGGPLSYWVGENIKFGRGDFVRANSLFPSFRGINDLANYVNPGMHLVNGGADVVITPRVQTSVNLSYLRFAETGAYNNRIVILDPDGAVEINVLIRWRPLLERLNENLVFDTGFSVLHPLAGLRQAFQSGRTVYTTFSAFRFIF